MIFSPFSCPIFLGHAKREAAAPKANGCFMGGTALFGRNRDSRSGEAAERRNSAEAALRKTAPGKE